MSSGLLLVVIELGLRIFGVQAAYRPEALGQWRVQPGLREQPMKGPRDGHSFRLSTNPDGLRTQLAKARSEGLPRVALLGDSTVFGWGVDEGQTVADAVAEGLPGVEVLNAGQPGYSTTQAAWLMGEVVADYAPDIAVFFIPMHDHNQVLVSDRELLQGGAGPVAKLRVGLARQLRLYQALRRLIFPATEQAFLMPDQSNGEPRVPRVSDAERSLALAEAAAALAAHGGQVTVGWLPFQADLMGQAQGDRPSAAWVAQLAPTLALPVVDVRACCRGKELVLADDPGHLSAAGNRAAGLAIADLLRPALGRTTTGSP